MIGAGVSGLATARQLVDAYGLEAPGQVVVLESRARLGGRIWTDRSMGTPVELGANWIHGFRDNPITKLAKRFGAKTVDTPGSFALYDEDGTRVGDRAMARSYRRVSRAYAAVLSLADGLGADQSLARSLAEVDGSEGLEGRDARLFAYLAQSSFGSEWGASNADLSTLLGEIGSEFSGVDRLLPQGYSRIVDGLAEGLDVRLEHAVRRVEDDGERVEVHTDRGTFEAERCVVTLPLGVLQAGTVEFRPGLPEALCEAIARIGFGQVCKLVLEFPSAFWDEEDFLGLVDASREVAGVEWFNLHAYSGVPILSAWTVGADARSLEGRGLEEATEEILAGLRRMYGPAIPKPTAVRRSSWIEDPNSLGAYSFPAVGSSPADYDAFLSPVRDRIFFAGEHTSAVYPSTVHGAYLSGLAAAARVAGVEGSR